MKRKEKENDDRGEKNGRWIGWVRKEKEAKMEGWLIKDAGRKGKGKECDMDRKARRQKKMRRRNGKDGRDW